MKFNAEKTNMINMYILEKIDAGSESLSSSVADAFGISTNTVHSYLRRLQEDSVIVKAKRGKYKLVTNSVSYELSRSAGDLDTDTYAFDAFFEKHIKPLLDCIRQASQCVQIYLLKIFQLHHRNQQLLSVFLNFRKVDNP